MRTLLTLTLAIHCFSLVHGQGYLLPREQTLPPLQLVHHRVKVLLEDQVAITTVRQTFRNQASQPLEAIYTFHIPRGAVVKDFSMMIHGKKVKGELVESDKAKAIYNEIVRRTMDPGLLEYTGTDLLQMSVFPVAARGEQEVEISFTSLARQQDGMVEFLYPLRAQSNTIRIPGEFQFEMELKSSRPIHSIYSPTHPISISRKNDRWAILHLDKSPSALDRDLQLIYTMGKDDIGITALQHSATPSEGYVMLLMAPRMEMAQEQRVPRDLVFVLDTSGSMREDSKLDQAKRALRFGLDSLKPGDRFTVLNFATTVNSFSNKLVQPSELPAAKQWVDRLEATGGTAIQDALLEALKLQDNDPQRNFTIIFFTDGRPTVGETNVQNIL
ncbi:MAG TPA: VIT and VWA domain-containing protein, partial [Gemmatales bacterium]|nr:VIT and VWA domain-containing protein [Gemmatales bacterium]